MATPAELIKGAASLMNDTAQTVYTNEAVLPYFNMALDELQEYFELNNVSVTDQTSAVLNVPKNTNRIGVSGTIPTLPINLIEIQTLYESDEGRMEWTEMTRKNFIPNTPPRDQIDSFIIWSWNGSINLYPANVDKDLRIDYVAAIFTTITIGDIAVDLGYRNIASYLRYKTAALCAFYIGENKTRSDELNALAELAKDRSIGINTKSKQSMLVRRRPFRAAWKTRGMA